VPVLTSVGDAVVRAHYLQRLARLAQVDERALAERSRTQGRTQRRQQSPRDGQARQETARAVPRSPQEEYALALLLRYPRELREPGLAMPEWAFTLSEHRRIYQAWRERPDPEGVQELAGEELHKSLERIRARRVPPYTAEEATKALNDCLQRMQQQRLREIAGAKAAAVAELQEHSGPMDLLQAALSARGREPDAAPDGDAPDEAGAAVLDVIRIGAEVFQSMYDRGRPKQVQ
jgi:DNA primase